MSTRAVTGGAAGRFPATRGSAILAARSADRAERNRGLDAIVGSYWRPVYTYLRLHWGKPREDAADLTQEFFARALEKDFLGAFEPARARFRTFLRVCVDRLVANEERDARRLKRGGGLEPLSLDFAALEGQLGPLAAAGDDPETLFERAWVRGFFANAVEATRRACAERGRPEDFLLFERHDLDGDGADGSRPSYADLAREHGIRVSDVTNRLAAARRAFRRIVFARLRELTTSEEEFRREARALLGVEPPRSG